MPRLRHVMCLVFAMFALSGCNTICGIGQDVKKAGESVEDAAD